MADKGVYVGMLYIGAIIEHSAFHTYVEQSKAANPVTGGDWGPPVNPSHLAQLLWNMHKGKGEAEARYPMDG
jgi:hypothetical protein